MGRENFTRIIEENKIMTIDEFKQKAIELDKNDKLAHFRNQFEIGEEIYLDGNSLGRLPKKTIEISTNLIKNQWGRIIAIGSICGIESRKEDRAWFSAAKASQHAIIKSFSKKHYFTKKNITFNTVSPGPIFIKDTGWDEQKRKNPKKFKKYVDESVPTKNLGEPEDISNLCLFLSSDYAKFINGSNFVIDGGVTNVI